MFLLFLILLHSLPGILNVLSRHRYLPPAELSSNVLVLQRHYLPYTGYPLHAIENGNFFMHECYCDSYDAAVYALHLNTRTASADQQSISRLDSELSNKRQRKDKAAGASTSTSANGGKPVSPQKNGNTKQTQQNGGRPGLNRAKSNGGGKPASGKGGAAKNAPPALSPEEEEKRRKRAERFNAAS